MNDELLISSAIDELVSYYSSKEETNGILKEITNDSNGMTVIRLTITYTDLMFETDKYFGFGRKLEEISKKTNVKVLIDFIESIEFGLLGIFLLEEGQPNCCGTLIDGEILFDRTGKYKELKKIAKRIASPKVLRRVRTPHKLGYANKVS